MSDRFQRTVLAAHRSPSWVTSTETVPECSAAWALTVTACSIAAAGDTAGDPRGRADGEDGGDDRGDQRGGGDADRRPLPPRAQRLWGAAGGCIHRRTSRIGGPGEIGRHPGEAGLETRGGSAQCVEAVRSVHGCAFLMAVPVVRCTVRVRSGDEGRGLCAVVGPSVRGGGGSGAGSPSRRRTAANVSRNRRRARCSWSGPSPRDTRARWLARRDEGPPIRPAAGPPGRARPAVRAPRAPWPPPCLPRPCVMHRADAPARGLLRACRDRA